MDERDQERQLIDAETEGTGRLRGGVEMARTGVERAWRGVGRARLNVARARPGTGGARAAIEDGAWFIRERIAWPVEDGLERLGPRGAIGVFGGGGIAVAAVAAALLIGGSGGSGSAAGTTEALVTPQRSPAPAAAAAAPRPKKRVSKPTGPTLHGAPPDFSPAQDVRAGVGEGKALGGAQGSGGTGGAPAARGGTEGAASQASGGADAGGTGPNASGKAVATASDAPAATAKIGSTPAASASAEAQAADLAARDGAAAGDDAGARGGPGAAAPQAAPGKAGAGSVGNRTGDKGTEISGPPAPKAAKKVARRFAEAFVLYEVGGIDGKVRKAFNQTSTKQLSRSLLHRPPRQPANVKVPQAKVVNLVAGPSKGTVYTVSVSLLRVGVTSELRLEMEQGVGKKWQVTNVLG